MTQPVSIKENSGQISPVLSPVLNLNRYEQFGFPADDRNLGGRKIITDHH
jgi:hypothetical protein